MFHNSGFVSSPTTVSAFTDVKEGDQYYNEITYATEQGYFSGIGNDQFNPEGQLTRAMYVVAMRNVANINGLDVNYTSTSNFNDVESGSWYEDAVNWAVENDLISGYGNGNFGPNDIINREQMAVIMVKFAELMNIQLDLFYMVSIDDDRDISDWARLDVKTLVTTRLISLTDGKYSPKDAVTRSLAASVFVKLVDPDHDGLPVLYEGNGLRVFSRDLDMTSRSYAELGFYITYDGDEDIVVQVQTVKVNGKTAYPIFSSELSQGSKVFTGLTFFKSDIKETEVTSIEFVIYVGAANMTKKLYTSDKITLTFSGKNI